MLGVTGPFNCVTGQEHTFILVSSSEAHSLTLSRASPLTDTECRVSYQDKAGLL